jgi:hypothetical protein
MHQLHLIKNFYIYIIKHFSFFIKGKVYLNKIVANDGKGEANKELDENGLDLINIKIKKFLTLK